MGKISIIGVPMDLGADRRGVDMGPSALRYADLNEKLIALGYGPKAVTDIFGFAPKIRVENAVMIGIREVDPDERELVKKSGVRVFTMKEIDKRGIGAVMDEALALVTKGTDGFSVTLDADFLDPYESPGVATPVRGGADYREARLAMEMIADTKKMVSFEITEINPILDVQNKTAHFGMELILSAFGKQIL